MFINLPNDTTASVVVYSDWFVCQADNALFFLEVFFDNITPSGGSLTVEVLTKPNENAGMDGTNLGSFSQLGSTGLYRASMSSLKDLVRFRVTVAKSTPTGHILLRFLPMTWYATPS